jgi:hypothetical protein
MDYHLLKKIAVSKEDNKAVSLESEYHD